MELRQLSYFLAVADSASMTEAATRIHVSQPALSNTIRDLEAELGFPLFERKGKRLVINESGLYLAQRARVIFGMLDEARATAQSTYRERRRTINCALNLPIASTLSSFLGTFLAQHPDLTVRLGYEDAHLFEHSSLDATIFGTFRKLDDPDTVLLGKERFLAVLPRNHRFASELSVSLSDLKDDAFILSEPSEMRRVVDSMFIEAGFVPHVVSETQLHTDSLAFVEAGMGCCIAPEVSWLGMGICRYDVAAKPLDDVIRHRYLYARVNPESASLEATEHFVRALRIYAVERRALAQEH